MRRIVGSDMLGGAGAAPTRDVRQHPLGMWSSRVCSAHADKAPAYCPAAVPSFLCDAPKTVQSARPAAAAARKVRRDVARGAVCDGISTVPGRSK